MRKLFLSILLAIVFISPMSAQIKWVNPLEQGENTIHGRWWKNELKDNYHRMPERAEKDVRKPVWDLSQNSAGLSIVFRSNSPEINVRYLTNSGRQMTHMPATGVSGIDMYATDQNGKQYWCAPRFNWAWGDTIKYTYKDITYHTSSYEFHLYLPLYNTVTWMEIGVPQDKELTFIPESLEKPIVVYGTSIAQGAVASRPGMAWTNIIERETEHPVINLAFSGNGKLEESMFHYLSEINAKLYIIDCLPNMTDIPDQIYSRMMKGVDILRAKNSTPILLVEQNYCNWQSSDKAKDDNDKTNNEFKRVYKDLQAKGIKGIYYLSREEFKFSYDSMVEGIHPTDLGMRQYANGYEKKLKEIFHEDSEELTIYKPCTQQRDFYNWKARHNLMIQRNRDNAPQIILLGNSITHFWTDNDRLSEKARKENQTSFDKLFKGKVVNNMGFGWDRIENGLWRIYHGELDGFDAEKVFLLLGTNNFGINSNEEIVSGMMQLIHAVKQHQPKAKIYQVGIMPRRNNEERVETINKMIEEKLKSTEVTYVDMTSGFIDVNGKLIESMFIGDGLHPNAKGYENEAKNLAPYVKE